MALFFRYGSGCLLKKEGACKIIHRDREPKLNKHWLFHNSNPTLIFRLSLPVCVYECGVI